MKRRIDAGASLKGRKGRDLVRSRESGVKDVPEKRFGDAGH